MNVHWIRALGALALTVLVATCFSKDDPTGVSNEPNAGVPAAERAYPDEQRAVELARVIPALAGFYHDTAGNVIVALTDAGEASATTRSLRPRFAPELLRSRVKHPTADVMVRGAQYTFLELRAWRERLMKGAILERPGVVWLDLDEVANRLVVGVDGSDVGTIRAAAQTVGVPAEVVDIEVSGRYVPNTTLVDEFRPIQGGVRIQRVSGTSRVSCTLGFPALWNNQQVFLTAGHCSPSIMTADNVAQFQPTAPLTHADSATMTPLGREISRFSQACGNNQCANSDAAIYNILPDTVPPIPPQIWRLGRVARPGFGCAPGPCNPVNLNVSTFTPYWTINGTRQSFVVNDLVSKIGSATGWSQGWVQRTCVNVSPSQGVTYLCQMFANYGSGEGDSGSPILLDIHGGADSNVTLGGVHSGRSGKNDVFSPWSGIVQDYGALEVQAPPPDTTWPVLIDGLPDFDTSRVVALPNDTFRVYLTDIGITFDSAVSASAKAAFFASHDMTVLGVTESGRFFVRIPDPGASAEALFQVIDALQTEPEVEFVIPIPRSGLEDVTAYRLPVDGPGQERADWLPTSSGTWAMRAIRAPLAWGCETGLYSESRARLAIFEWKHQAAHPELAASSPQHWEVPDSVLARTVSPASSARVIAREGHATWTTGLLSAQGNNRSGIAGVNWRSRLYLYSGYSSGNRPLPLATGFSILANRIQLDAPRVLSISVDQVVPRDFSAAHRERLIRSLARDVRRMLDRLPNLTVVVAAGNERFQGSVATYLQDPAAFMLRGALLVLREQSRYTDRIIVVAGTSPGNSYWAVSPGDTTQGSNFFTNVTDIAAPAQEVTVLARWTGQTGAAVPITLSSGTSLSAPLVAGVAGLLLAMDSTRDAEQIKNYLLSGAIRPRLDPQTGEIAVPNPVAGAPGTIHQLDAYGSLGLLASDRDNIPLCGNRTWVTGGNVLAEHDTTNHTTQQLANLGEAAAYMIVRHGGRRFEVFTDTGPRAFELRLGQWVATQDTATSPHGGTYLSLLALSHDLDSSAQVVGHAGSDLVDLEVKIRVGTNPPAPIDTISVPLPRSGSYLCTLENADGCVDSVFVGTFSTLDWRFAYAPPGDRVFVSVTTLTTQTTGQEGWFPCPWAEPQDPDPAQCTRIHYRTTTDHTDLYAIDIQTRQTQLLWPVPGKQVYWLAESEDGAQLVGGEGSMSQDYVYEPLPGPTFPPTGYRINAEPQVVTGCSIVYRIAIDPGTVKHSVSSVDACTGQQGQGTLAPAKRWVGP